jgi:hypothetical protein
MGNGQSNKNNEESVEQEIPHEKFSTATLLKINSLIQITLPIES